MITEIASIGASTVVLAFCVFKLISWIQSQKLPTNQDNVAWKVELVSGERYFLKHFNSSSYPGCNNLTSWIDYSINEDTEFSYEAFVENVKHTLGALQRRHQLLQVGLLCERGWFRDKWFFAKRKFTPEIPLHETRRDPSEVLRSEMNRSFEYNGPFMRITVCRSDDDRKLSIVFCFHHIICDGASTLSIFKEFNHILDNMDLFDASSDDNLIKMHELERVEPKEVPKSIEEQCPANLLLGPIGILVFIAKVIFAIVVRCKFSPRVYFPTVESPPPVRTSKTTVIELDKTLSTELLKKCKSNQVGFTSTINAAMVDIADQMYKNRTGATSSVAVPVTITADLRRVLPQSGSWEDCRYLSSVLFTCSEPKSNIWDIARESQKVIRALLNPEYLIKFHQVQCVASMFPTEKTYRMPFVYSNMGVLDHTFWQTKQFQMKLVFGCMSMQGVSNQIGICSFTTDESLRVCLNYNNSLDQHYVEEFTKKMEQTLIELAA